MIGDAQNYPFLRPPKAVSVFDPRACPAPQRIDYRAHPAYGELARNPPAGRRLRATGRFLASLVPLLVKRIIHYELIPNEVRSDRSLPGRLRFLGAGLRNAVTGGRRPHDATLPMTADLQRQGCSVVVVPPEAVGRIEEAAASAFDMLAQRRAARSAGEREFDESRLSGDRHSQAHLYAAIDSVLEQAGVIAAASEYLGRPARLVDVNPQINDRSDSFWRNIFPDLKLEALPGTAYFHRDASGGDLKAIIYMTNVTETNGPFSYVVGSHRLALSRLDNFICEANDHNGLGGTDPEVRTVFASLPRKFRQKGSFGNDLPDDAPASAEILRASWAITGPKGAVVLFDTKGIHRGGMVDEGERRVITCVIG